MPDLPVIAVFSDIHGNSPALQAALNDARQQGANQFWAAGDLLGGGPFPAQTFDLLRAINCQMILGNADQYLLDYNEGKFPPAAQTSQQWSVLRWAHRHLPAEVLSLLKALPSHRVMSLPGLPPARMVHGSPRKVTEGLIPEALPDVVERFRTADLLPGRLDNTWLGEVWHLVAEDLFICGHTHIGWAYRASRRVALNPGSLGSSTNGDWRAQYALLRWDGLTWQVEQRAVPYDTQQVRRAYQSSGLLEQGGAYARACLLNTETGMNVVYFFICHVVETSQRIGVEDSGGFSDEAWLEAARTFDWTHYEQGR